MCALCINGGSIPRIYEPDVLINMTMTHDDFDAANYLLNETDIQVYLTLVMENDDPELLSAALDDIARARSRIQVENARLKYEA